MRQNDLITIPTIKNISRRHFIFGAASAAFLIACGDSRDDEDAEPTAAASSAFPVAIQHKFGTTTVSKAPARVISLGYSEQDPILALGVKPIAVREWFGEQPYAVYPWAKTQLGDGKPEVLKMTFGQLNYEQLAGLAPDLIVATHSGITQDEYGRLSQIAPTLAQTGSYPDFGMPWQEQTKSIGQVLGKTEQANKLVADVEAKIVALRKKHPEYEGKTIAMSNLTAAGAYFLYSPTVPALRVMESLGFKVPADVASAVGSTPNGVNISQEQFRLLDVDALIWYSTADDRVKIESDPVYSQLRVGKEGRGIFLTRWAGASPTLTSAQQLYSAFSFCTALSLPFALDLMEKALPAVLDGDPNTKVSL